MTTHAPENDRFISARMHRERRAQNCPRMTPLFPSEAANRGRDTNYTLRDISSFLSGVFFLAPITPLLLARSHISSKSIAEAHLSNNGRITYLRVFGGRRAHMSRRLFWSVIVVNSDYGGHRYVSASAMLLSVSGGLCGPVRYIRAVEGSE